MTIWFSTNIPEMRAISTFNRVSTDISEIQQRITTGQRINSGRDDPGGLILREGLRADIKGIHGLQAGMMQAENLTNIASDGMMQLLNLLVGADTTNPSETSLIGALNSTMSNADVGAFATNVMNLYNSTVNTNRYNNESLLAGTTKTYRLGGNDGATPTPNPYTLTVAIPNLSTAGGGEANALINAVHAHASAPTDTTRAAILAAAETLQTSIAGHLGTLGGNQSIVAMNQRLLDSRLTSTVSAEGRISNADIAVESSRMARSELLAQNAMNSIMYTRNYAAFSVRSLFG